MVRLTDSNEEEVHAKIRRAYEDARKMEEEEKEDKEIKRYLGIGFIFLNGFFTAMILSAYNC
jgi:hypothetical protein